MWNPFKRKKPAEESGGEAKKIPEGAPGIPARNASRSDTGRPDEKNMNFMQRMAMKKVMAMKPMEREKLMQKMMTPKNIAKHKDEIMAQLEYARKNGMMTDDQYRLAKRKFGL